MHCCPIHPLSDFWRNPKRREQGSLLVFLLLLFSPLLSHASVPLVAEPVDLTFTSSDDTNWSAFPLQVEFTQADHSLLLDAFWCGDRIWKVRFAAPTPGTWEWRSHSDDPSLDGRSGTLDFRPASPAEINRNPNLRGQVRVAGPEARHFAYADGAPIFLLADTNWSINTSRCGIANGALAEYLEDRQAKGFNSLLIRYFGLGHRNEGGYAFLDNALPSTSGFNASGNGGNGKFVGLNPAYWESMDTRMRMVWEAGFVTAGHPAWLSDMVISLEDAIAISRYLYARYAAFNLIWSLSGEYVKARNANRPPFHKPSTWTRLGEALQVFNQRAYRIPVSIHPSPWQPTNKRSSSIDFNDEDWIDHHWLQTDQGIRSLRFCALDLDHDRRLQPPRPLFHSEGWYEDAPRVPGMYVASDYEARFQAWVATLNGACGHGYGHHLVWKIYDPTDPAGETGAADPAPGAPVWRDRLDAPGAFQVNHLRAFLETLSWWQFEPCRELLEWTVPNPRNFQTVPLPTETNLAPPHATRIVGGHYLVYLPRGSAEMRIRLTDVAPGDYEGIWICPREGTLTPFHEPVKIGPDRNWNLPFPRPSADDWAVVLTATAATTH